MRALPVVNTEILAFAAHHAAKRGFPPGRKHALSTGETIVKRPR